MTNIDLLNGNRQIPGIVTMFSRIFCALSFLVLCVSAGQVIQSVGTYRYVHRTWPNLIGSSSEAAKVTLLNDMPGLIIEVREAKNGIISTIQPNQVYLFVDDDDRVVTIPETIEKVPYEVVFMSWPEAVGMEVERAKELIHNEKPEARFQVLPEGSLVTLDLRVDRVRLFVNDNNVVVGVPSNG